QLRDELDRVDGALRGDAQARQQAKRLGVPRVLDRGDRRRVELAGDQAAVELRRHAGDLLVVDVDAEEDGRHGGVGEAPEPDHGAHLFLYTRLHAGTPPPSPLPTRLTGKS